MTVAHCAKAPGLLYWCQQGLFAVQAWEATDVLVLTRKGNQSIMIGDEIEVRIGIAAPRSVPVFRKEVYLEIQEDRAAMGDDKKEAALDEAV